MSATTALAIITDAFQNLNRLSPGEALSSEDADYGFQKLNLVVDELSARNQFLFRTIFTSGAQTGHITLGSGSWATIDPGEAINGVSLSLGGVFIPMTALSVDQYSAIPLPTLAGDPRYFAADGLQTVYLYPVPSGQTVRIETSTGVSDFADLTTSYTVPPGYKAALGAILAVRLAPKILGNIPPHLVAFERMFTQGLMTYVPAIVGSNMPPWNIISGF